MMTVKKISNVLLKSMALVMLFACTLVSCKKNHDDVNIPPSPVEGKYSGKYGFGNDAPDTEQKYSIKAGGVFQEIGINSGSVLGQGTWQLNGNVLTATYAMNFAPFSKYSISAVFNEATGKLVGTWGNENSATDGGKIDMTRQ